VTFPGRGEVWLVDLGMTAKVRPCVVISVEPDDTDRALLTIVPHTTSVRGTRFECPTSSAFLKAGAFDAQGIATIPRVRVIRRLGMLRPADLAGVEHVLCAWLGITSAP
jgi:mRNA interferase MazF